MKNKKLFLALCAFIVILLSYTLLTTKIGFTDSAEYINIAKEIRGISNTNVFVMHDMLYSLYLAPFLLLSKTAFILKLANVFWLIALAILFYFLENKKAFILLITSPIIHLVSIHISPLIAVVFFIYLAYFFFREYEKTANKLYLIFSGLSFGVLICLRTELIFITFLFSLIFFYNKTFKEFLIFLVSILPTLSVRFLIDYYYFGNPIYTIISFMGSIFIYETKNQLLLSLNWILIPIIIAPFLFLIYKIDYKKYKREIIFLSLTLLCYLPLVTLFYGAIGQLRLLLVIVPISLILLSKIITKKQLIFNSICSLIVILIVVYPTFISSNEEKQVIEDLNLIKKEFDIKTAITTNGGAYSFPAVGTSYWGEKGPHYIWNRDYELFLQNKTAFREVTFVSKPKINVGKLIEFNIIAEQNRDKLLDENFDDKGLYFILNKNNEFKYNEVEKLLTILWRGELDIKNIDLVKCYQILCVFKKK